MSAATTLTRRRAKAARPAEPTSAPTAAFPATREQEIAWLECLENVLDHAANTDEAPGPDSSGESDRLLRVASELAGRLLANPKDAGDCSTVDNRAYTIASLIKAALQVPGDTPSAERLAFIEQARAPLVGLTDCATVLDGWDTYPSATPSTGSSAGVASEKRYHLSGDQHNSIYMRLDHAEAVLSMLVHVFGGDANTEDPMTVPGLKGALQHIQWLTRGLHSELSILASKLPPGLVERVAEANAMIDLMEHLESNGGFQFNRWSDALTCSYFSAIEHSVKAAIDLLDEVGVGNA